MKYMSDDLIFPDDLKPTRADAVRNRELLLETAQRLFNQQGVAEVSMTAIAEAAGVGKGTLYRHFKNKADLAYELLDQDMRDLQTRVIRRLQNHGDPVEDLHWFVEQVLHFVERNSPLLCIAESVGGDLLNAPAHLWWRQTICGLLARSAHHVDLDYGADLLYIMLDAPTIRFQQRSQGYDLDRILAGLRSLVTLLTS